MEAEKTQSYNWEATVIFLSQRRQILKALILDRKCENGTSLVHCRENHSKQENSQTKETRIPKEIAS